MRGRSGSGRKESSVRGKGETIALSRSGGVNADTATMVNSNNNNNWPQRSHTTTAVVLCNLFICRTGLVGRPNKCRCIGRAGGKKRRRCRNRSASRRGRPGKQFVRDGNRNWRRDRCASPAKIIIIISWCS